MQVRVSNRSANPIILPPGCGLDDKQCWLEPEAYIDVEDEVVMKMGSFSSFVHLHNVKHLGLEEVKPDFAFDFTPKTEPPPPPAGPPAADPKDFQAPVAQE